MNGTLFQESAQDYFIFKGHFPWVKIPNVSNIYIYIYYLN